MGYLIPTAYSKEIGERLALHGIQTVARNKTETLQVDVFRAAEVSFSNAPFEGRMRATLQGEWRKESQRVPEGSLLVPIAQPRARLLMGLLEPKAPDSFAAWGFFNGCFEHKEHVEPYVAEQIAQAMLKNDATLAAEFHDKLKTDSSFAQSSTARHEFFLRRHSSWDERLNLYPIYRI